MELLEKPPVVMVKVTPWKLMLEPAIEDDLHVEVSYGSV